MISICDVRPQATLEAHARRPEWSGVRELGRRWIIFANIWVHSKMGRHPAAQRR